MSAPFLDQALIVSALQSGLPAGTVAQILDLGSVDQVQERRALTASPALLVIPQQTNVSGPIGMGNGREIQESIGVVIQLRNASPDAGASARPSIRTIRAAVFDALEGLRVDQAWAPLRYLGGHLLDLDDYPGVMYRWMEFYQTETPAPVRP